MTGHAAFIYQENDHVTGQNNNFSWFSVDVISFFKLGFHHIGAHARSEIVCKSMPFLGAHDQHTF